MVFWALSLNPASLLDCLWFKLLWDALKKDISDFRSPDLTGWLSCSPPSSTKSGVCSSLLCLFLQARNLESQAQSQAVVSQREYLQSINTDLQQASEYQREPLLSFFNKSSSYKTTCQKPRTSSFEKVSSQQVATPITNCQAS